MTCFCAGSSNFNEHPKHIFLQRNKHYQIYILLIAPLKKQFKNFVLLHYENTPMQYTVILQGCKNYNFQLKNYAYFHIFAQIIDCGYTLEPPQ